MSDRGMAVLLGALGVLAAGWYLSWTASRLDRLHARIEGAWAALDAQLVRRASVALEIATSGLVDPASAVLLAGAAQDARDSEGELRELAESDLSKALRAALEEPEALEILRWEEAGVTLLAELAGACQRVSLARRFYNDAVRAARVVRAKRTVRLFRLAGHAALPQSFEMDDEPPLGLGR